MDKLFTTLDSLLSDLDFQEKHEAYKILDCIPINYTLIKSIATGFGITAVSSIMKGLMK